MDSSGRHGKARCLGNLQFPCLLANFVIILRSIRSKGSGQVEWSLHLCILSYGNLRVSKWSSRGCSMSQVRFMHVELFFGIGECVVGVWVH